MLRCIYKVNDKDNPIPLKGALIII